MRTTAFRTSFIAIAAIGVALLIVAIAVAQPGDSDDQGPAATTTLDRPSLTPIITDAAAETDGPAVTDVTAAPTNAPGNDPTDAREADENEPVDDAGTEGTGSVPGTTPATNPAGHCVELPNDSDIVLNPDKHPNWTVGSCEPGGVGPPDGGEPDSEGVGPPEGRTPSLNPDGVCVSLPNNSDIVRNPDKHPEWVVGGCDAPVE